VDTLKDYFSLQDKIKSLEEEIIALNKTIRTLRVSRAKYKQRYRELANVNKPPTRTEIVREVLYKIKNGEVVMTHREISKKFHVSLNYVRELSHEINKELRKQIESGTSKPVK